MKTVSNVVENNNVIPVIIGTYYNAYSVIRSFAEKGIKCILVTDGQPNFVEESQYVLKKFIVESPSKNKKKFIVDLIKIGEIIKPGKGMLFPTHDEQLLCLAENKRILESYFEFPFSEYETLVSIMDKRNFARKCHQMGIPTARECFIRSKEEGYKCLSKMRFPLIIKIDMWEDEYVKALDGKIKICFNEEEYKIVIEKFYKLAHTGELLVQEYIEDSNRLMPNINSFTDKNGEMMCVFVSEKIRQYPPQTGTSVATIAVDPEQEEYKEIISYAQKIVKEFCFYGLFGIEFKYDIKDEKYKVIEMNCRSEFPNYLQVIVGQNMAYNLYQYHLGKDIDIPYYPILKSASCYVPFLDWFYNTFLNKLNHDEFVITEKARKRSLCKPTTPYGLDKRDRKAFCKAYILAIRSGIATYIREKYHISASDRIVNKLFRIKRGKTGRK